MKTKNISCGIGKVAPREGRTASDTGSAGTAAESEAKELETENEADSGEIISIADSDRFQMKREQQRDGDQ